MIAAWMLFAGVVGLALTVGAWALERALRALGRQMRGVWLAAMLATILWPAVVVWRVTHAPVTTRTPRGASDGDLESRAMTVLPLPGPTTRLGGAPTAHPPAQVVSGDRVRLVDVTSRQIAVARSVHALRTTAIALRTPASRLDRPLLIAWIAASSMLLAHLLLAVRALRRGNPAWRHQRVNGTPVLVSRAFGPAVVGLRDPRIVIPGWVLSLGDDVRAFVVRHEQAHRASGDPLLLVAGAAIAAVMPWNAALWIQLRRLRLAVEMDCDRRVVGSDDSAAAYGVMLVSIAEEQLRNAGRPERLALGAGLIVATLTEPASDLERRIVAMISPTPRHPRSLASGFAVVAGAALLTAARTPAPPARSISPAASVIVEHHPVSAKASVRPDVFTAPAIARQDPVYRATDVDTRAVPRPAPAAPAAMGLHVTIAGRAVASFIVSAAGRVEPASIRITDSTSAIFSQLVRSSLAVAEYSPAIRRGRAVRQAIDSTFLVSPAEIQPLAGSTAALAPVSSRITRDTFPVAQRPAVMGRDSLNPFRAAPPLYIVDGVPLIRTDTVTSRSFVDSFIESVEVIRGALAEQLYGSLARGGAIVVTTKAAAARVRGPVRDSLTTRRDTLPPRAGPMTAAQLEALFARRDSVGRSADDPLFVLNGSTLR